MEPAGDSRGHGGADALDLQQLLLGRGREPLQRAEVVGEDKGRVLPDMGHAEGVEQPVQRHPPAGGDARDQVVGGAAGEAVQLQHLLPGQPEEVGGVLHVAGFDQGGDDHRAHPLDVQGRAAGEVDEPLPALRGTERIDTAAGHLPVLADELGETHGAGGRRHPGRGVRGTLVQHHPDDLGDDVAGLVDDHGVAGANVLARHLVLVVQGAALHRRAGDQHWLEQRDRRAGPGAPDVDQDVLHPGLPLLGRELVRDGPAG